MDIRLEGLTKRFGETLVLDSIDLSIASGELLGLLGPSGSGKTTLLRGIAGLEIADGGRIFFGGEDATRQRVQDRGVGFVFQNHALFRHMTVADNIAYGLRVRPRRLRPSSAEIGRRVEALLELVRLGGYGTRFPAQLSGGQRQRIALARALAVEPRLLLLDEPFGALDLQVRRDLRRWLREIHDRTGHTTLFVTHDQDEALELSDRIAILNRSRVEQIGRPGDIYDEPATPFVFSFVGDANALATTVAGGRILFEARPLSFQSVAAPDGPATLFLRPEDCRLARFGAGGIDGHVSAVSRIGATRRARIAVGHRGSGIDVALAEDDAVAVGDAVSVLARRLALFPEAGGPPVRFSLGMATDGEKVVLLKDGSRG